MQEEEGEMSIPGLKKVCVPDLEIPEFIVGDNPSTWGPRIDVGTRGP